MVCPTGMELGEALRIGLCFAKEPPKAAISHLLNSLNPLARRACQKAIKSACFRRRFYVGMVLLWKSTFRKADTTSGSKRMPEPVIISRDISFISFVLKSGEEYTMSS